ncbi:MAG: AIR synthase-related protein [Lachnospiraceae bacterium]|nr:AIR synthase-related protein [Lachnospiraceae bacterium]
MDIIVTKWIALEGTVVITETETESLLKKFPSRLIQEAKSFTKLLDTSVEEKIGSEFGIKLIHKVGDTGIFGALWALAEEANVGLEVDLRKIPVRQETIEIFNFVDINPYEYSSDGMLLMFCEDGTELLKALEAAGILASIIGTTTNTKNRIVSNKDRIRFLTPK